LSSQTGVPMISQSQVKSFHISFPSLQKQHKIVAILASVDAAIEQTDAIIAQTERMKKSLMQELLTKGIGHKAYKDVSIGRIPIEWDVQTCESVCEEIVVGIVVKPSQYYSSSGVPALRSANIHKSGIDPSNLVFITEESNRMLSKSMVRSGNVLTVRTGYPGTSCVVPPEFDGCNCIDIIISRPKPEIISSFLSTWINSDFGKKQVLRVQSGLAQQHFNIGELKKMLIAKPSVEEQQMIMSIINVHDLRLCLEESYLNKLKQLKRGLMQDLLTGRVPVIVEDAHA
ncbi:MAG: restriction endonuclease subunit S, partial [Methanothrix sp.]|nr:restriction endonuclease subunit S [Methanothrix sp.]